MFGGMSINFLNDLGYDAIAHPQEGIDPLQVLIRDNAKSLRLWGPMEYLAQEGIESLPQIQQDLQATAISGAAACQLDTGAGIKLLNELLSAVGIIGPRVEVGYTKAHTIEFTYENVLIDRVFPIAVWKYLGNATPSIDDNMKKLFDDKGEAFVITDTLKSNSLGTIARDKSGRVIEIDIAAIKNIVGINAKLSRAADGTVKCSFDGSKHIRFGFKVLPMRFVSKPEKKFVILKPKPGGHRRLKNMPTSAPESTLLGRGTLFEIR